MKTLNREEFKEQVEQPIIDAYIDEYSPEYTNLGMWHQLEGITHESGMDLQVWLSMRLNELWINYLLSEGKIVIPD